MISLLPRHKQIVGSLIDIGTWLKGSELAREFNVSDRTIRNDINYINDVIKDYDARIESIRGKGYRIEDKNVRFFQEIILQENESEIPVLPDERIRFIIEKLLFLREGIDIDDLADEMLVSKQTLEIDLKRIRELLEGKNTSLSLIRNENRVGFDGSELDKRSLLCSTVTNQTYQTLFSLYNYSLLFKDIDLLKVKDIVLRNIQKSEYIFSDIDLVNLIIHSAVSVKRIMEGFSISFSKVLEVQELQNEIRIAEQISREFSEEYGIAFDKTEVLNIARNIFLKRVSINHEPFSITKDSFVDWCMGIVEELIRDIRDEFKVDFTSDKDLKTLLSTHIQSLIKRIQYNTVSKNPFLDEVKNRYPFLFELSVFIRKRFFEITNLEIEEDEIGFIAIHLAAAIERLKINANSRKVHLICHGNAGHAQFLMAKLQALFQSNIEVVGPYSSYDMDSILKSEPDMIISTMPLPEKINIPNVSISMLLTDKDILKIRLFMSRLEELEEQNHLYKQANEYFIEELFFRDMNIKSREEIIEFMADHLIESGYVRDEFKSSVMTRENISPTSFDNLIAIPHSIEAKANKTGIAVVILKNPIKWGKKLVQIVFMFSVKKGEQKNLKNIYKLLQNLILVDKANIKDLISTKGFEEFVEVLVLTGGRETY